MKTRLALAGGILLVGCVVLASNRTGESSPHRSPRGHEKTYREFTAPPEAPHGEPSIRDSGSHPTTPAEPRPPSGAERDGLRLSRWLIEELSDEEFARLLKTPAMETYVSRVASVLLRRSSNGGSLSPEARAFLTQFNARVARAEAGGFRS